VATDDDDLRAALGHLADRPNVDRDRPAVVGICMGRPHVPPVVADVGLRGTFGAKW
jgi:dienelactone hydrolase